MEQHFILPIKAAWIAILLRPSNYSWIGEQATNLEINQTSAYCVFWTYVVISVLAGVLVLFLRRIPPAVAEGTVFAITLVDGIFLAVLTVVTGGYNSPLYWIFLFLIVRTAVNVPRPTSQLLLNLTLSTCFVLAGVIDSYVAQYLTSDTVKRVIRTLCRQPRRATFAAVSAVIADDPVLLRAASFVGTPSPGDGRSARVCDARRPVAFSGAPGSGIRTSNQEPPGDHQYSGLFASTRDPGKQERGGRTDWDDPGRSGAGRSDHYASHGVRAIKRRSRGKAECH
jgi:hypothetical protein